MFSDTNTYQMQKSWKI